MGKGSIAVFFCAGTMFVLLAQDDHALSLPPKAAVTNLAIVASVADSGPRIVINTITGSEYRVEPPVASKIVRDQ